MAGLTSSLRFITPIEARILCEEQIAVVLEVLSEPAQQALLYRILRRLDWTESSADRVLKAEGWDDPSAR